MNWSAIVPLKIASRRKTRLAQMLTPAQREALSVDMFCHVADVLRAVPRISDVVVLCGEPPEPWRGRVIGDTDGVLNSALADACNQLGGAKLLIVNADLPFLSVQDVDALIDAAECGCAIAPDRHELGTNALALQATDTFLFSFGAGSLRAHCRANGGKHRLVRRMGLAFDIDTPDDLELAKRTEYGSRVLAE